jgi:hypothetical protein
MKYSPVRKMKLKKTAFFPHITELKATNTFIMGWVTQSV